jgi:hypothetical protein
MPMRRSEMRDDQCWSSPTFSNLGFSESSFFVFSILPRSSILIMRIVWSHNFQASSTHKDPLLACGNTHSKQGVHFFETLITRFHGKCVCSVKFIHSPNQNHCHCVSILRIHVRMSFSNQEACNLRILEWTMVEESTLDTEMRHFIYEIFGHGEDSSDH